LIMDEEKKTLDLCFAELDKLVPRTQRHEEHVCDPEETDHGVLVCKICCRVMECKKRFEIDPENDRHRINQASSTTQQQTRKTAHDHSMEDISNVQKVVRELVFDCSGKRKEYFSGSTKKPKRRCTARKVPYNNIELATKFANKTKLATAPADLSDMQRMEYYIDLIMSCLKDARLVEPEISAIGVAVSVLSMKSSPQGFDAHPLCGHDEFLEHHMLNVKYIQKSSKLMTTKQHTQYVKTVRKVLRMAKMNKSQD